MRSNVRPARRILRAIPVLAAGLLLAWAIPQITGVVVRLGRNVPQPDITWDYAFALYWAVFLGLSIFFWPIPRPDRRALAGLWVVKSAVALGFMLLYEGFYPAGLDAYGYFEQTHFGWQGFHMGDGTWNIVQMCWLYQQLLPHSFHAMKVSFAMLGMTATYILARSVWGLMGRRDYRVLYGLGLFPSILFWSSIVGKDPVVLFAISLYVAGVLSYWRTRRPAYLLSVLAGVAVAALIRLWLVPAMLLPLGVLWFAESRSVLMRVVALVLAVGIIAGSAAWLRQQFALEAAEDFYNTATAVATGGTATGESATSLPVALDSPAHIALFLPYGAFTALFRPLPGEILNPFGLLAGLENALLLYLVWLAIRRSRLRDLGHPLVLWALAFVVTWACVYSVISVQNLGGEVRFRLQVLPVMLGLLVYLARPRQTAGQETK